MALELNNGQIQIPKKVFGIAFAIAGIGFGYWASQVQATAINQDTSSLVSQNKELTETESNLVSLQNNSAQYVQDTEQFNKESEEILKEFPTFMFLEDKILYADELRQDEMSQFNLTELTYGNSNFVMSTSYDDTSLMELYSVGCSAKFEGLTYPQVKELINFGKTDKVSQRFVLNNIDMNYNEDTGYLNGEFSFNTYFVAGQNEPYVFDSAILELIGEERRVDDLFGTREASDDEAWDEQYGDIVDDVINDIIEGNDFATIDD